MVWDENVSSQSIITELEGYAYTVMDMWEENYVCACITWKRKKSFEALSLEYGKPGLILSCATQEDV